MADFDPAIIDVKRDALEQLKSLPPPPAHLIGSALRLRALVGEMIHRLAENDAHHRLPGLSSLIDESARLAAALGYLRPPMRIVHSGDRERALTPGTKSRDPVWVVDLYFCEPGARLPNLARLEAWFPGEVCPTVLHDLGTQASYIKCVFRALFRWIRHLDLPPLVDTGTVAEPPADFQDGTWVTSVQIAKQLGIPHDPVRKRLDRWRKKNFEGHREDSNAPMGESKYCYEVKAIRPILEKLKATAARPPRDRGRDTKP